MLDSSQKVLLRRLCPGDQLYNMVAHHPDTLALLMTVSLWSVQCLMEDTGYPEIEL